MNSRPSMVGMWMSVRMASKFCVRARHRPSLPSVASQVWKPARFNVAHNTSRDALESSTTRMRALASAGVGSEPVLMSAARFADGPADRVQQIFSADRLGQDGVCAEARHDLTVAWARLSGQHQYRNVTGAFTALQNAEGLVAVHDGHLHVEQH